MRLRRIVICPCLIVALVLMTAAVGQPGMARQVRVKVPAGTMFLVALGENLSSQTNSEGDTFSLECLEDVKIDGTTVVKQGSKGLGAVAEVQRAGWLGKSGRLRLELLYILATNGMKVPIEANKSTAEKDKEILGPGTVIGFIFFSVLWLAVPFLSRGKDVQVAAGTSFHVATKYDVDLLIVIEEPVQIEEQTLPPLQVPAEDQPPEPESESPPAETTQTSGEGQAP